MHHQQVFLYLHVISVFGACLFLPHVYKLTTVFFVNLLNWVCISIYISVLLHIMCVLLWVQLSFASVSWSYLYLKEVHCVHYSLYYHLFFTLFSVLFYLSLSFVLVHFDLPLNHCSPSAYNS